MYRDIVHLAHMYLKKYVYSDICIFFHCNSIDIIEI